MGMWSGVNDADATGDKKPWFEPGKYFVRIDSVAGRDGRNGKIWFIVEAEVLQIESTEDEKKMKEGKIYSQTINYSQDMGPINVKRFILAAMGLDPSDDENNDKVGEEEVEFAVSEEQPLAGVEMWLQCDQIETRAGKPFTKYTWFAAEGDEDEDEGDEAEAS
jgi:hypothetical protein